MGEVFRARDTKLNRDVAIKVLPPLLAALNHPNIAHIHGLEEAHGVRALVMELVEGDDLSAQIARGPANIKVRDRS
jgi:serine/threonine protein kinase